jgi:SAM-dependent methyltransferase
LEYLNVGHYAGIDPNDWLREAAMSRRRIRRLVETKRPIFLSRSDFDASELGRQFDYVLSHSVLSHCAYRQLDQFVGNVARVLRPGGCILASIRLAEGNAYGSSGAPDKDDSMDEHWRYPGVSWFKFATVRETAERHQLTAVLKPDYTESYVSRRPDESHDWIVFRNTHAG